jgi:hypothetical protein
MKNLFKLILFFLGTTVVMATNHNGKFTKQKTLQKTVIVNSDATLSIKNKYGNLMITTWDEDKIGIEVTITVSADSEKWVEQKLNLITVDFSGSKSLYYAETKIDSNESYGRNSSMEINYIIKIPKNGSVKLDNKYGDIIMHDLNGSSDIICKYGRITLGKLNNSLNTIKIDYCTKSTIESVNKVFIEAKYSGITIENFDAIDLNSSFTDVIIANGTNLNYKSNYGKITVGKVTNLEGNGNYLTINIDEIQRNLKLSTNYSNLTLRSISEKANDISIQAGYTNIKINYSPAYVFDFDISTKYGNFKTDAELTYNSKVEKNSSNSYQGFYKKSGVNNLRLSSNYGNISLYQK